MIIPQEKRLQKHHYTEKRLQVSTETCNTHTSLVLFLPNSWTYLDIVIYGNCQASGVKEVVKIGFQSQPIGNQMGSARSARSGLSFQEKRVES